MAAQLWEALRADLSDVDAQLERGDFDPLKHWLRERVHAHGRKFPSPELLARVTGQELAVAPFVRYLRAKLSDAGVLRAAQR
jgi:carboxypeptidase Taq